MLFGPVLFGPVLFDPVLFGPVLFDPVLFDPVVFGPVVFGPVLFGPVLFDPVLFDPVLFDPALLDSSTRQAIATWTNAAPTEPGSDRTFPSLAHLPTCPSRLALCSTKLPRHGHFGWLVSALCLGQAGPLMDRPHLGAHCSSHSDSRRRPESLLAVYWTRHLAPPESLLLAQ